jgi:YMGG-like Gly-zipper
MGRPNIPARMMLGLLGAAGAALAGAQAQSAASPAASLGLFVYPAKGQDAAQQSKDETECYGWSKTQSGFDPAAPAPAAPAAAAPAETQGPGGERLKGAARGAAAGAVIGEVADDDASKGAEVGAAAGVIAGGRQARKNRGAQEQQAAEAAKANEEAAKAAQQQVDTFKRGLGACLEGRGYTVK